MIATMTEPLSQSQPQYGLLHQWDAGVRDVSEWGVSQVKILQVRQNYRPGKPPASKRFGMCLMSLCLVMWFVLTTVLLVVGNKLTDSRDNSQPTTFAYHTKGCDWERYTEWPKVNFNSLFRVLS